MYEAIQAHPHSMATPFILFPAFDVPRHVLLSDASLGFGFYVEDLPRA
jgi:hypothetical protein